MSQSLSMILVHVIFSTKSRYPFLDRAETRAEVHAYLAGILHNRKCPALLVGGVADHVHILCQLGRMCAPADLVKEAKRSSSLWIQKKGGMLRKFHWQDGYGAFSIGRSQVDQVTRYIQRQEARHRRASFQDEYREFLRRYEVEYDEQYVWA